jgi:rhomboid protease GluP
VWRDQGLAAGASGAIFGLFGIFLALLSTKFYEANARKALLISTAIFVGYTILPKGGPVDHAAHFGGLVSGYLFGWITYFGLKNQQQKLTAVYAAVITVVFTGACIWLAPVYQFKEFKELSQKTERLSDALRQDFYGNYTNQRDSLMMVFTHKALPEMDTLKMIAKQMQQLVLPKKEKQIAQIKSQIISEECKLYGLIYKEYRDKDQVTYRDEINQTTQTINELRMEWGKVENANNDKD